MSNQNYSDDEPVTNHDASNPLVRFHYGYKGREQSLNGIVELARENPEVITLLLDPKARQQAFKWIVNSLANESEWTEDNVSLDWEPERLRTRRFLFNLLDYWWDHGLMNSLEASSEFRKDVETLFEEVEEWESKCGAIEDLHSMIEYDDLIVHPIITEWVLDYRKRTHKAW